MIFFTEMLSVFIVLYVFAEPFEDIEGRWAGVASLSSIIWLKNFDLGEFMYYDLNISYLLSLTMSLKAGNISPVIFTIFNVFAPFTATDVLYFYVCYLYTLYQIYKMGETRFLLNH